MCRMPESLHHYKSQRPHDVIIKRFEFTKVFRQKATQDDIFNEIVKPRVFHSINGKNSSLVTYGTTGSGAYNIRNAIDTFQIVI